MEAFGIAPFLILVGLGLIAWGGLVRAGWYKRWYLMSDNSIFFDKSAHYAFIPLGLSLISLSIMLLLPPLSKASDYALYGFFVLGGLGVILFFWQPRWLKPDWVHWLEENHADILDLLIREARETPSWGQRVSTQAGLEQWVAETRQRHGLSPSATPKMKAQEGSWLRRKWPIGLVIVAVSSGAGQYFLGSGLIGFLIGWGILGFIYVLQLEARKP
jgi:hypothetical protein